MNKFEINYTLIVSSVNKLLGESLQEIKFTKIKVFLQDPCKILQEIFMTSQESCRIIVVEYIFWIKF